MKYYVARLVGEVYGICKAKNRAILDQCPEVKEFQEFNKFKDAKTLCVRGTLKDIATLKAQLKSLEAQLESLKSYQKHEVEELLDTNTLRLGE